MRNARYSIRTVDAVYGMAGQLAHHFFDSRIVMPGIYELLMNAIEHGNLEIGFELKTELLAAGRWEEEVAMRQQSPRYLQRKVEIELSLDDMWCALAITDAGQGFDWTRYASQTAGHDEAHGRGLLIAQQCGFASLQFNAAGNQVRCAGERRLLEGRSIFLGNAPFSSDMPGAAFL